MKSSRLRVDKRRRTYVRLLGEIQHALLEAIDQENRKRGLTRAEIARALGTNKSVVSRKLNGESNMTLESLADLAFALDRPVKVTLPARHGVVAGSNHIIRPATTPIDIIRNIPPTTTFDGNNISSVAA